MHHRLALDPAIALALAAVADRAAERAVMTAVTAHTSCNAFVAPRGVLVAGFLVRTQRVSESFIVYITVVVGVQHIDKTYKVLPRKFCIRLIQRLPEFTVAHPPVAVQVELGEQMLEAHGVGNAARREFGKQRSGAVAAGG